MSDPWTIVGSIAAVVAAGGSVAALIFERANARITLRASAAAEEAVRLQRAAVDRQDEDLRRQELAERPGFAAEVARHPKGLPLVMIRHIKAAPYPLWRIASVRSLDPDRVLLLRSRDQEPTAGPPAAALTLDFNLPAAPMHAPATANFFVVLQPGSPVEHATVELQLLRDGGGEFSWPFSFDWPSTPVP